MAENLTDDEELQLLKNWWKENGKTLVTAVLVGLIAYFGFQWWQNHQKQQSEKASALYSELLSTTTGSATSDEKQTTAKYLIDQLKENYSSYQYAVNASLLSAKTYVDDGDLAGAEVELQWAMNHADDDLKALVQLRLARVYVSQDKHDEALSLVNTGSAESFTSLYSELKGDILAAQEDWSGARAAYEQAINTLDEAAGFRQSLLPIKLSDLPAVE